MISKYFVKIFLVLTIITAACLVISPKTSAFDLFGKSCSGDASGSAACKQASQTNSDDPVAGPGGIINKAANIVALITGIGAVIMIIIGGLNYTTSGGNAEKTALAKRQIIYSLVAVAIVALAWTLTTFIINLTG